MKYYLQDTSSYVGNEILWCDKKGRGYTTDINKAHVYSAEDAFVEDKSRSTAIINTEKEERQ